MRLTPEERDLILEQFSARLNGGTIVFYPVNPESNPLAEPLVNVPFHMFVKSRDVDGTMVYRQTDPAVILKTGEARWADLMTATGEAIAGVRVRAVDDPEAEDGDILVDRTDFHRGGLCTLTRVTLSLPLQS